VLQEKLIGYYSEFDIDINDWYTEFENMEIFRARVKNNLGADWFEYHTQTLTPQARTEEELPEYEDETLLSSHMSNPSSEQSITDRLSRQYFAVTL
jgi:hypothetical protein